MKLRSHGIFALLAVFCATISWATVVINFGGLREMTERAGVIAVVRLNAGPDYDEKAIGYGHSISNGYLICPVEPVRVIKGPAEQLKSLRRLGLFCDAIGGRYHKPGEVAHGGLPPELPHTELDLKFIAYQNAQVADDGTTISTFFSTIAMPKRNALALVFCDRQNADNVLKSGKPVTGLSCDYMPGSVVYLPEELAGVEPSGATDLEKVEDLVKRAIAVGNPYAVENPRTRWERPE